MTKRRQIIGSTGEQAACRFLNDSGYEILETNYRCPLGEIDIVARNDGLIIFVEVRTKTGTGYGSPRESITTAKGKRLKNLARYYMQQNYQREITSRIDLIAVMLNRADHAIDQLEHIPGILF